MFGTWALMAATAAVVVLMPGSPAHAQPASMTFFVTSVGSGNGADLGGLDGADGIARSWRRRPARGKRTWHAYLSTQAPRTPA